MHRGEASRNHVLTDINHIVHMGQSLGAGEQSLPLVTTEDTGFGNLKFAIGTHTWSNNYFPDTPALREWNHFAFVPLTAQQRGGEGETIANGMCDHLSHALGQVHDKASFLFSYAGQGGRYLRELNKRHDDAKDPRAGNRQSKGGYYKTSIDDVRRAKRMADSLGMSYSVFAATWMQGEANGNLKMNRWDEPLSRIEAIATYKSDLIDLKSDYQADIREITGQENAVPFFTYQTAGNVAGRAQLEACNEVDDMYMVGPTYMLPNAENGYYTIREKLMHGDGIHLTADGERWLGEQFGKVMKKVCVDGVNWQPLQPIAVWHDKGDNAIFVKFHVPHPPLVIDTTFLPAQGRALGFHIYDVNKTTYEIDEVTVTGPDILRLRLKKPLIEGVQQFMRYGLNTYVADISVPVGAVIAGTKVKDGHESIDIVFESDLRKELNALMAEGVFYLNNITTDEDELTNLIVREVFLNDAGHTVLRGEADDLRNNIPFKPGQSCFTSRRYSYGNVRDSDDTPSVFKFSDAGYGNRAGQPYPLYNWCVSFDDWEIEMRR